MSERCSAFEMGKGQCRARKNTQPTCVSPAQWGHGLLELPEAIVIYLCPKHFVMANKSVAAGGGYLVAGWPREKVTELREALGEDGRKLQVFP